MKSLASILFKTEQIEFNTGPYGGNTFCPKVKVTVDRSPTKVVSRYGTIGHLSMCNPVEIGPVVSEKTVTKMFSPILYYSKILSKVTKVKVTNHKLFLRHEHSYYLEGPTYLI